MKKLFITCAMGVLGLSAYAQGLVTIQSSFSFSTNSSSLPGGSTGHLSAVANAYYFELLEISDPTGSTTTPSAPTLSAVNGVVSGIGSWSDSGVTGTNATGIGAGHISGTLGTPGQAANGWAAGATNFFVVVGWSANEGSSWSSVLTEAETGNWLVENNPTAFFGISVVGYGASTALAPGLTVFGAAPGEISTPFTLQAITTPEPASMALAAIGGASLLLFRRKK